MHSVAAENFAARMLMLSPTVTVVVAPLPRRCSVALWFGRLYGYAFSHLEAPSAYGTTSRLLVTLHFTRNDEPGARRRAEWMRNPAGDPAYPAPITWHVNGGPGYHPPGWHPNTRIVITADVEASLRYNDAQFAAKLRANGYRLAQTYTPPAFANQPLPPLPPPPPPPGFLAYPDEPEAR